MKVISIMGFGHSGSTVLGIVLGNHLNAVCVGELHKLPRSGWTRDDDRRCACGLPIHECEYWMDIYRRWIGEVGDGGLPRYVELQNKFERSRWCWPRLLTGARRHSSNFATYTGMTAALYDVIAEVSGKSIIIDTSKPPNRNYALLLNESLDARLIHLVRDGRGVTWSLSKSYGRDVEAGLPRERVGKEAWRTSLRWALTNLESEWVAARAGNARTGRVNYESFVERPAEVLREIAPVVGEDLAEVSRLAEAGKALDVGHMVGGNKIRMAGSIVVRPDFEWRAKLPPRDEQAFWRISGRLAQRYGYRR